MIQFRNLTLARGARALIEGATLQIHPGHKVALTGANGTGKSSLFALLRGELHQEAGDLDIPPAWVVAHVAQETPALSDPALEFVLDGDAELRTIERALAAAEASHDGEHVGELHARLSEIGGYAARARAAELLHGLGFADSDFTRPVSDFSGGWRVRLNLARALMCRSDLLLLDEPTNHLDAESIAWLQKHLIAYKGTILIVTHDRYFLDDITSWILELDRGRGIPYEGNYSSWLDQKAKRMQQEAREDKSKQKALEKELEWIRSGAKARQSKGKARLARYNEMAGQTVLERASTAQIIIPNGERLGSKVIEVEGLKKHMGDKLLIENLSFTIPPGAIVGVIGPNGAGKSTLFRMITGQEAPDEGTITLGNTVHLAYVDQSRDALDPNKNVWEEISGGSEIIQLGDMQMNSRVYTGAFNFKGTDQQKKVGLLSGGERNRVHMAKLLRSGGNVLLLDEPTNDLDVETLQALESAIEDFAGCAIIISHDRFFLDRLCTHMLAFEGDAHVEWFEGNFEAYEQDKVRRLGPDALEPKRAKYKRFSR